MNKKTDTKELMLALDIGTRSVVGLLGSLEGQNLVVRHTAIVFHENRAMFDGQIHDIEEVSRAIEEVKKKLEEDSGQKLKEATIAAAGRALQTQAITVDLMLDPLQSIQRSHVQQIELKALQKAEKQLESDQAGNLRYFCVGHSVIQYYLDGGIIKNPLNHRGSVLSVHLIATFLPKLVVDSLYASVTGAGLDVNYMTLEPIAAIEVAVPENARLLNIALVDIGAGTSDIAITKEGTIHAYAMTDVAGDELTEQLAQAKMLDFDCAESLKCKISEMDHLEYTDILGILHEDTSDELLEVIRPSLKMVAEQICESILKHNGKKPSAVFLIGGGSQMKALPEIISQCIELPLERVSVRNLSNITRLTYCPEVSMGPEGVTPIGILKKALLNRHNDFIEITINGQPVKLFQTRKLCLRDGLAALRYDPQHLIPRRGKGITIMVNGERKKVGGEYGKPAVITKNNETANLESEIQNGDRIMIHSATIGRTAHVKISDLMSEIEKVETVLLNDKIVSDNRLLRDGDEITFKRKEDQVIEEKISQPKLERKKEEETSKNLEELCKRRIEIQYNGKPFTIETNKESLIFVDIFDYIDFDRSAVQGELVLLHNSKPAEYMAPIHPEDDIWVYWR